MSIKGRLAGRLAVVTGAASGIGRASSIRFASEGASVIVSDRDAAGGETVARTIRDAGGVADAVACDVADAGQIAALFDDVGRRHGRLDVLYNNAGISGPPGGVLDIDDATWQGVLDVNLTGVWRCCRAALPLMQAKGGSIINQSSVAALVGGGPPYLGPIVAYNVSKAAVIALTRSVAYQFGEHGIRCNALLPGSIETGMTRPVMGSANYVEAVNRATPLGRFGTPEEVAEVALFLATGEASFVSGEAIVVDGGYMVAQGPVFTRLSL